MPRRSILVGFTLVLAACTGDISFPTTTTTTRARPPVSTTTSITTPSRQGLVVAPNLIRAAAATEITQLEADRYLALAMFSDSEVPFEYLVPADGAPPPQWDHSVTTRLVERWDELGAPDRTKLLDAVDGLRGLVGSSGVSISDSCVPMAGIDALICVGDSVSHRAGAALVEAAAVVRPWVRETVADAWPKFEALLGSTPNLVKVFLSDLNAPGGYAFGLSPGTEDELCHVYVDVMAAGETGQEVVHVGDPAIPDGTPLPGRLQAEVVHELFHCFQQTAELPGVDVTLWEGTATWAEHYVFPDENTEVPWMETWVSNPDRPFASRLYDSAYAFLYADLLGAGSGAVAAVLKSGSIADLDPDFEELWHAISVASWNQEPVDPLVDKTGEVISATVGDLGVARVTSETEGKLEFELPLYSRDIQTIEFFGGSPEPVDFASLVLDLSRVPGDVRISALAETANGWLDPVLLTGPEWHFCRMAIGSCSGADPETIHVVSRIVLFATNVDNGVERFSIPWHTYNPHLHGSWVRTDGPFLTNPGATAPFAIVGTELSFDESVLVMTEDTGDSSLARSEPGWECTFGGAYSIAAETEYAPPDHGDVSGTVTVSGEAEGDGFEDECVFTTPDGAETASGGLHVPVVTGPTRGFGFEIRDYDTLWIYAFERIYVYHRSD